jgi:23S rRNA (cytidine1920-2'-O)/16S rRNA (cytidine1409-2'-O)-methyltransferase
VAGAASGLGLGVLGVTASPLPGPAGNVEYFVWLRRGAPPLEDNQLERAIAGGPAGTKGSSPRGKQEEGPG